MHDESSQITKDMAGRDGRIGGNKAGRDKGFALIVVLWLGVLLALMAAGFASAVTSRLRATSADADLVRAEAFADAGARIALLDLMNAGSRNGSPPRFARDGTPLVCALEGEAVLVIQAEDEEGKVNLNLADERLLTALFAGLGSTDDEARHYADAIIDFRDADDDKRLNGAERDDYHGKGAGPKNAAFQSIDELDQVLGLPAGIRQSAKAYLTTLSNETGIDESVASETLKSLLVKGSGGIAVGSSAENQDTSDGEFISSGLPRAYLSTSSRHAFRVRAEAILHNGVRYASDVMLRLPESAVGHASFLRWRRGATTRAPGEAIASPQALKPC